MAKFLAYAYKAFFCCFLDFRKETSTYWNTEKVHHAFLQCSVDYSDLSVNYQNRLANYRIQEMALIFLDGLTPNLYLK